MSISLEYFNTDLITPDSNTLPPSLADGGRLQLPHRRQQHRGGNTWQHSSLQDVMESPSSPEAVCVRDP